MKQVTIFGSTGFVGKNLTAKAQERGYKVKTLVRTPSKAAEMSTAVEVIIGDYFNEAKILEALEGSEAVLSTIGPPLDSKIADTDVQKYSNSLEALISGMKKNGISRIITIAGAGIKTPNEDLPLQRKMMRLMLSMMSKNVVKIKETELRLMAESELEWTSIRPPMIKENLDGRLHVDENAFLGMNIDVDQLTTFMLDEIDQTVNVGKALVVATK